MFIYPTPVPDSKVLGVQNDFDERGARVLTHGRVCSVQDIGHPSVIEMSVYLSDTGIGQNTFETKSPTKFASISC